MSPNLEAHYSAVDGLRLLVAEGSTGLHHVPRALSSVIETGAWREFSVGGELVRYERFADFVTTPPLEGLGTDVATLRRLCSGDVAALDALDMVTANPNHRPDNSRESRQLPTPDDKTTPGTLRRLRKDAPEIHARVLAGELSPHAGALEAGFRPRRVSVRTDDPASAARTLANAYGERLGELVAALAVLA